MNSIKCFTTDINFFHYSFKDWTDRHVKHIKWFLNGRKGIFIDIAAASLCYSLDLNSRKHKYRHIKFKVFVFP